VSIALGSAIRSLIGTIVLMLGGCAMASATREDVDRVSADEDHAPTAGGARPIVAVPETEPPASVLPDEAAGEQPAAIELAVRTPPAKPTPPPKPLPSPDPDKLLGMSTGAVTAELGAPAAQRDEPPAHVWRYTTDFCSLDVFFFLDMTSDSRRVLAYDIQIIDGRSEDELLCYREIEKRHAVASENIDLR